MELVNHGDRQCHAEVYNWLMFTECYKVNIQLTADFVFVELAKISESAA